MRITIFGVLYLLSILSFAQNSGIQMEYSTAEISVMEQRSRGKAIQNRAAHLSLAASQNYDVQYYRLELEVDPAVNFIQGKVTVYYKMSSTSDKIILDLTQNLTVSEVMQRATPITHLQQDDQLEITIPTTSIGVLDSVSIVYSGVPASSGVGSFIVTSHGDPSIPVMWSLSEPFGSKDWWPCKNGLDDKADNGVDIIVTFPSSFTDGNSDLHTYKAAANGLLIGEKDLGDGRTRTHWKHSYPIASYLVCFAITNYTVFSNSVTINGTELPMLTYCYPESLAIFTDGTQNALDALQYFSGLFGDYPFLNEKYGHVQFGWGGGMEHQTNSFMVSLNESLVAHELAHQWFGDKVTCNSWEDIWLNEGFATHLSNMYRENKYPETKIAIRSNEVNSITSVSNGSVKVDDITSVSRIFSNRLSYYKGSHLIYMLRWILGDAVFFEAITNYLSDPALAYKYANTANLKTHLETTSGKNLDYFFEQWFEGEGYPSYNVKWQSVGSTVSFTIEQTTSDASVSFFRLPVPLLFKNETSGQEKLVVVDNTSNNQSFTETLGFEAESVTIDPEYWLISKNNTSTKIANPLPVHFSNIDIDCHQNQVVLTWNTTMEELVSHFEIKKSKDAIHWMTLGTVDANGSTKRYSFSDPTITSNNSYYQILGVDLDGTIQPTRILTKSCSADLSQTFILSPNPVHEKLFFKELTYQTGVAQVDILNPSGQILISEKYNFEALLNQGVNVATLPDGLYMLRLTDPSGKEPAVFKFIKN